MKKDLVDNCKICKGKFLATFPLLHILLDMIDEYYSNLCSLIKNKPIDNSECGYQYGLLMSFIRSSITVEELILNGMNIEAIVLIRKQVELLARLEELKSLEYKSLKGKTPNIKNVGEIKRTYHQLSEIAHSSVRETLHLLGVVNAIDGDYINLSITPVFDNNLVISMNFHFELFMRFFIWCEENILKKTNFKKYTEDKKWVLNVFIPMGIESKLPYFEHFKQ